MKLLHANSELMELFCFKITSRNINTRDCIGQRKIKALDQSIRKACREVHSNYYQLCGEEIKLLDSITYSILAETLKREGVPSDFDECLSIPANAPYYYLIQLHNNQWSRVGLDSLLLRGVEQCKLHPQLYANLMDHFRSSFNNQEASYGLGYAVKLGERLFVFDVPKEYSDKINPQRKIISLDSIGAYLNKIKYQYRHPEYILVYPTMVPTLDLGADREKELAEKWKDLEVFAEH
jgi:hypothetical protein